MSISNIRQVWFLAITVTTAVLAAAEILSVFLLPREWLPRTVGPTAVIVVISTLPMCLWVGVKTLENAQLLAQMRGMLQTDRLTGALTRDHFFSRMLSGSGLEGMILMVDLDRFRAVNDAQGHVMGDRVIRAVGEVLRHNLRADDLLCRFGGQAFVIFLPDTPMNEAFERAEHLHQAVSDTALPKKDGSTWVTVSIGGALLGQAHHLTSALQQAEHALLRAKGQGRNCTVFSAISRIRPGQVSDANR